MNLVLMAQATGVLLLGVLVALAGAWLVQRYIPNERRRENNEVAGIAFAIIGVLYAMLLTFVIVSVWESGDAAEAAAHDEVRALVDTGRYAETLDAGRADQLRALIDGYAAAVTGKEWPEMAKGEQVGADGPRVLDQMWTLVNGAPAETPGALSLQEEARTSLRDLTTAREARLSYTGEGLPAVMWFALLFGTWLTLGNMLMFGMEGTGEYFTIAAMLGGILFLLLFGVYEMEFPYRRGEAVDVSVFTDTWKILTATQ
jgi:hypothetical protein